MSLPTVVRAFVFNPEWKILMARHTPDTPWVLPGGHVESSESLHDAMQRELKEEFWLDARFFEIDDEEILHHKSKRLSMNPLPIASYDLSYTAKDGRDKSRTEYIFLMESDGVIEKTQTEEIAEYAWFDPERVLTMKPNIDTWDFYIEMLEKIIGEENFEE